MDYARTRRFLEDAWQFSGEKRSTIVAALEEYIRIPNDSPEFDPDWAKHGHMDDAMDMLLKTTDDLAAEWERKGCLISDIVMKIVGSRRAPIMDESGNRRTPLLVIDIPAFGEAAGGTALLYGHMDKQPALEDQWAEGLSAREAVIKDGKLYGRGGGDDGYALFSAFSAIMALREQGLPHSRCVVLVEAGEESGSPDLEFYINELSKELGDVTLIVCLDSGAENYDQLWITSSLRGMARCTLSVEVLKNGVHSGASSGAVPSSFHILNELIARIEDPYTGEITPPALKTDIPPHIVDGVEKMVAVVGADELRGKFPLVSGAKPVVNDPVKLTLNRTWRTQLAVIGIDGLPPVEGSGNVMLPWTRAALSFRLPPTLNADEAAGEIKRIVEPNPPYGAKVKLTVENTGNGWAAPKPSDWLAKATEEASGAFFGKEPMSTGEGGSIPFMNMLQEKFPRAQFVVTGVLGPRSNAHGPDEFLHLPFCQKVTMCVAKILAEHAKA